MLLSRRWWEWEAMTSHRLALSSSPSSPASAVVFTASWPRHDTAFRPHVTPLIDLPVALLSIASVNYVGRGVCERNRGPWPPEILLAPIGYVDPHLSYANFPGPFLNRYTILATAFDNLGLLSQPLKRFCASFGFPTPSGLLQHF